MKAELLKRWDNVLSSYWFLPGIMAVGAVAASWLTTEADRALGDEWVTRVRWLHAARPEGAREILSTVAGSMITVAGVTFSITILAFVHTSAQFGPRLLRDFMRDKGNQITLGTFTSTFLYCVLVLRSVQSPGEGFAGGAELEGFVPQLGVIVALLLAVASVGVLIYFIHHVPESIHAAHIAQSVGSVLLGKVESLYPEALGQPIARARSPEMDIPDSFDERSRPVQAESSGYIEAMDAEGLMELTSEHDLLVKLRYGPGDFVTAGKTLMFAWPEDRVDDTLAGALRATIAWGAQRTRAQDVMFPIGELVAMAGRSLSTGINDPFTAMMCMDWLGSALVRIGGREFPAAHRYDGDGRLRVIAKTTPYEAFVDAVFDPLRPYMRRDPNAARHMMETLREIIEEVRDPERRAVLLRHADVLRRECAEEGLRERELELVEREYRLAVRLALDPGALAPRAKGSGGSRIAGG